MYYRPIDKTGENDRNLILMFHIINPDFWSSINCNVTAIIIVLTKILNKKLLLFFGGPISETIVVS